MNRFLLHWGMRLGMLTIILLMPVIGWAMSAADYNAAGVDYLRQSDYDKAIVEFSKAITADPRCIRAYNNRACAYIKLGRYDEALKDVGQALAIGPGEAAFYDTRGAAYAGKKLYPGALKDFKYALSLDKTLSEVYAHRARVYMETGRWSGALSDYQDYIRYARPDKNDPDLAVAKQRCNDISRMMPELQARDAAKLGLAYSVAGAAAGQQVAVEWEVAGNAVTLRHTLDYSAGAKIKVVVESVKHYGEYTLIQICEQDAGEPGQAQALYNVEAGLKLGASGKYIVQLWGVARYAPPSQPAKLIGEKTIIVE